MTFARSNPYKRRLVHIWRKISIKSDKLRSATFWINPYCSGNTFERQPQPLNCLRIFIKPLTPTDLDNLGVCCDRCGSFHAKVMFRFWKYSLSLIQPASDQQLKNQSLWGIHVFRPNTGRGRLWSIYWNWMVLFTFSNRASTHR